MEFKVLNNPAKKAEINDNTMPLMYRVSTDKMMETPTITSRPSTLSRQSYFFFVTNGAVTETNSAEVAKVANATETFEALMAAKKVIQCAAAMPPMPAQRSITESGYLRKRDLAAM